MPKRSSTSAPLRYSGVAIVLHWLVAALIAANLLLIWFVDDWPARFTRPIIDLHKSIGITVLGLVAMRILWRASHAPPPLPHTYPPVERKAAHLAHLALYVLILGLPLSGWLHDSAWKAAPTHPLVLFGVIPWPRIGPIMNMAPDAKEQLHTTFFNIHKWLAYALYVLFVLHVGAALKHQWIDRKPELQRMLPGE